MQNRLLLKGTAPAVTGAIAVTALEGGQEEGRPGESHLRATRLLRAS